MSNTHEDFEQNIQGWPGANFRNKTTAVHVRRIKDDDRDEAQIEIHICEVKQSGRLFSMCSSIHLTPEDAVRFADALLNPRGPKSTLNLTEDALRVRRQLREISGAAK